MTTTTSIVILLLKNSTFLTRLIYLTYFGINMYSVVYVLPITIRTLLLFTTSLLSYSVILCESRSFLDKLLVVNLGPFLPCFNSTFFKNQSRSEHLSSLFGFRTKSAFVFLNLTSRSFWIRIPCFLVWIKSYFFIWSVIVFADIGTVCKNFSRCRYRIVAGLYM